MSGAPDSSKDTPAIAAGSVQRAFGSQNRARLLANYFAHASQVAPETAWRHVYSLLLWTDRTTGLAHCYESDKAQPGRPWYGRTRSFHRWLCEQFGVQPRGLAERLDWLFRNALQDVRPAVPKAIAEDSGEDYPVPGEDPGLAQIMCDQLQGWLRSPPPADALLALSVRVRNYYGLENKRKNLVGEGFEDVLAEIVRRLPKTPDIRVEVRPLLHSIPGFHEHRATDKPKRVDLAITRKSEPRRVLVSAKWSIRADREEQFASDFEAYARLESEGKPFDYVLVTNEFDAARLLAACERQLQNQKLFTHVVHVNPAGPLVAYGEERRRSASRLVELVETGRMQSLASWLAAL